jgi:ATP-dependent RNA helicase RhlE
MNFEKFDLNERILEGVEAEGYVEATPIQEKAIPIVLAGNDVIGLASTGTGKTAAFVLPILNRLIKGRKGLIRSLIIAPTRELAEQINDNIVSLGRNTNIKSETFYGGVGYEKQRSSLKKGIDIAVACPGRLLDHVNQGIMKLKTVELLVIDEADRMFDMGFMPDVRKILRHVPKKRQTLLFSATMPDEINRLARDILNDPVKVQVDALMPTKSVSHFLMPVKQHLKTSLLKEILKRTEMDSVLVFTRTKQKADRLAHQLKNKGIGAVAMQGDMSQKSRQAALDGFRDGRHKILVATDIAARGIDVLSISHVINFDIPENVDSYTHRTGRTGRAKQTGEAYTFVTPDDLEIVQEFESQMDVELVLLELDGFDYDAPPPPSSYDRSGPRRQQRRHGMTGARGGHAKPGSSGKNSQGRKRRHSKRSSS